jgi:hypothetical protein
MKIWDLPRTEEEAIRLFQDKRVLPKTKQLLLTGACRTVSNDALQVLAGRPPIDLELAGRMAMCAIGTNRYFNLLGITVLPIAHNIENENMRPLLVLEAKRLVRERIHQLWQERWSSSPQGLKKRQLDFSRIRGCCPKQNSV